MKQWQIPNNSKVEISKGLFYTFLKMDGMYAKWKDNKDRFKIGNYEELE